MCMQDPYGKNSKIAARQSKRKVDNEEELDTKLAAGNSEESPDEHRGPSPNNSMLCV